MVKLHIAQDDHNYWMLSVEQEDGSMGVLAHQFSAPEGLIEMAQEIVSERQVDATIVVAPPRAGAAEFAPTTPPPYEKPMPRKAGA